MNKQRNLQQKILKICLFNKRSPVFATLLFLFSYQILVSQSTFLAASAFYDDSFRNWEVITLDSLDNEHIEVLELKWPLKNDWTEWKWDTAEQLTYLEQTYRNNDSRWTYRFYDSPITMQAKWRNDPRIWTITHGELKVNWKTAYNLPDQWIYEDKAFGYFEVITTYENDVRDWEIIDESSLPDEVKRSMIFISLYVASPRQ